MTYKLFIDDERFPPDDGSSWVITRSSNEAINYVGQHGLPTFISFDHDLADKDTAMVFVRWLQEYLLDHNLPRTFDYYVHSQNPVGRDNIIGAWDSFDKSAKSFDA